MHTIWRQTRNRCTRSVSLPNPRYSTVDNCCGEATLPKTTSSILERSFRWGLANRFDEGASKIANFDVPRICNRSQRIEGFLLAAVLLSHDDANCDIDGGAGLHSLLTIFGSFGRRSDPQRHGHCQGRQGSEVQRSGNVLFAKAVGFMRIEVHCCCGSIAERQRNSQHTAYL